MAKEKPFEPDPKLLRIIEQGALRAVVLQPLTYRDAVSLRMKLYRLKDKLVTLAHAQAANAKLITIKLDQLNAQEFAVTVQPRDLGFEQAFANAGITKPEDEPPPLE